MHSHSCWTDPVISASLSPGSLDDDATTDVCVVGGGIAGLTTAFLLSRDGLKVMLIEATGLGHGETMRTSAHLASALDDRFYHLERLHGLRGSRLAAESHAAAIDFIEAEVAAHGLDCGFARVDGYLFTHDGGDPRELERELAAARRAGLAVSAIDRAPGLARAAPALRFANQAQFEPLRYLGGLASWAVANGTRIHIATRAKSVTTNGSGAEVVTEQGKRISAGAVVVATNVPVNDRVRIHPKLEPHRSYVIAADIPRGAMPPVLMWDTADPYHYIRTVDRGPVEGAMVIVGGEDHPTGQGPADPAQPHAELVAWMRRHIPAAGEVIHRWSGQIIETVDSLAYIGPNPGDGNRVFIITGDSGNGLTHGTLGAMIVADQLRGRDNPWAELYRPDRLTMSSWGELAGHNAHVLGQYSDWLTTGDVPSADHVRPGQGAVVRDGLGKLAVYRNDAGVLHVCSAVCPHLGGLVRWNAAERTWDCPCHGSRFDAYGKVLNGPANVDLAVHQPTGGGLAQSLSSFAL